MSSRLIISTLLLACPAALSAEPKASRPPNIVFILADDLGWNGLGCQGNPDIATPNLDRLAAQGMRFTQAYAEAQCSPTRGCLFSGQWPARTGMFAVVNEADPMRAPLLPPPHLMTMPPETASLFTTMRAAGYVTGMSGKWHIGDSARAAGLKKRDGGKYPGRYGLDFIGDAKDSGPEPDKTTNAITDDMIGFINENRDRPFFAYLAHHTPHAPLEPVQALVDKYVAKGFKRSSNRGGLTEERPTADYYAMIEHLDESVGRVLAALEELHLAENTVVIFASDNGGLGRMASMAPLRAAKGAPYEGGIRVPLIVRWPGQVAPASTCDVPVHAVDYYPTFAALGSATVPAGHKLDGVSIVPLLTGGGSPARDTLYWHMPTYTTNYGRTPCAVIRRGGWKLIHYFGDFLDTTGAVEAGNMPYGRLVPGERTELYHLTVDPAEKQDLAGTEPGRVKELSAALTDFLRDTGAAFPRSNPVYDPKDPDWWKLPKGGTD